MFLYTLQNFAFVARCRTESQRISYVTEQGKGREAILYEYRYTTVKAKKATMVVIPEV